MEIDVETFLTAVYCHVDDLYRERFAAQKPVRPGRKSEMSDSEVLTIAILAQWHGRRSERAFLGYVERHWRCYFLRLLSQSALNRRIRDLAPVLCALGPAIAQRVRTSLVAGPAYQVIDGIPVPLMRRCRGERHRLFGDEATIGRGGTDRDWYYGVRLLEIVDDCGLITGFVVGPANTEERWLAEALLRWRVFGDAPAPTADELAPILGPSHQRGGARAGPTGPIASRYGAGCPSVLEILGDLGFAGQAWSTHWLEHYGARVVTERSCDAIADPTERERAIAWFHRHRQIIETVHGVLDTLLHLKFPRARTYPGLLARIGAKIAAFNVMLAANALYGRPLLSHVNPLA